MTQKPIACTLPASDQTTRGNEWRQFLVDCVVEVVRTESSARLRLLDGDEVILNAVDLARREKACCAFFDFDLALLSEEVWLEVRAPGEAAAILDELLNPQNASSSQL